ncbi:hypothetical protein [Selenomonas sp. FC4001]|uniref:hypothetical protein n=1 Tax=Selenomonas sp. FC4001 TaxID=1408313 RepID=UPI00055C5156|nr:hypothetical protein [Selenomonas sp. FC4001]
MHSYNQIKYLPNLVEFIENKEHDVHIITDDEPGIIFITFEHDVTENFTVSIIMQIEYCTVNNSYLDNNKIIVNLMAQFGINDGALTDVPIYAFLEKIRESNILRKYSMPIFFENKHIIVRYNCFATSEMNEKFYVYTLADFLFVAEYVYKEFVKEVNGYICRLS